MPDAALTLWDLVVTCSAVLIDEDDARPWRQRLDHLLGQPPGETERQEISSYLNKFAETDLPRWVATLQRPHGQRFLQRLLGARLYHRLEGALREDIAVLGDALRQGIQLTMPYIVALNDVTVSLTPDQLSQLPPLDLTVGTLLRAVLELDQALCQLVPVGGPLELLPSTRNDHASVAVSDLAALTDKLRQVVSGRSRAVVSDLNAALARKMRGARDALAYSADPVSQAANSLIELLDRLLRSAFSEEEVLAWIDENYSQAPNLIYVDASTRLVRATKKARALCFTYAGQRVIQPSGIHELVAAGVIATRTQLQQLKHADTGTIEDTNELLDHMAAVEAFLTLAVGLSWTLAPAEQVERLRARLDIRQNTAPSTSKSA